MKTCGNLARASALALVLLLTAIAVRAAGVGPQSASRASQAAQPAPAPVAPLTAEQLVAMTDEVTKEVEALRGWTFKQPIKKELTSVEQVRAFLQRQADKDLPPGKAELTQAFLHTIGLIPPDVELKSTWLKLLENQVEGFYDSETKTMHLVARSGVPPVLERTMLAHELTHALDDQYAGLDAFMKLRKNRSEDGDLAGESVVEGSATALMMQYMARAMMAGRFDMKAVQEYAQQEAERSKIFTDSPRYFSAMLGAYFCGMQFLARGQVMALMVAPDDKAVGEALLAARKDPPQSTEQIIHPAKYWDPSTRDDPVVIDDDAAARWLAQPGRWIVHKDTVGEMLIAILTGASPVAQNAQAMQADAWTNAAATGWGGDRFYLLASGDTVDTARTALKDLKGVWVTAWDTPKDRDEFIAALPQGSLAPGAVAATVGDTMAIVYFGLTDSERSALTARFRDAPLPMTKGGKPWK